MSINLNNTTPAAPANNSNVTWQKDGSGNVSAYVPTSSQTVASVNATAQAANISATDLVAAGSVTSGLYRISIYIQVTQAASVSSTMPSVTITYTDPDASQAQSISATSTSTGNSLTTLAQATVTINAKTGVAIQYATASYASSGGTPMQYALHIKAQAL